MCFVGVSQAEEKLQRTSLKPFNHDEDVGEVGFKMPVE